MSRLDVTRLARWFILIFGGVLVTLWVIAAVGSRTSVLQQALMRAVNDHLESDVELANFHVSTFPSLSVTGDGLRLRFQHQRGNPPLIEIAHFSVDGGILGLLHRPRRFRTVRLQGLKINVPARGIQKDGGNDASSSSSPREGRPIIDHLVSNDAELVILPKTSGKEPKRFAIHTLQMESIGFDRAMPFGATLTNPTPRGSIETSGMFGPWRAADPGSTPLIGSYRFSHADLNTIHGLAGTLSSSGGFTGELARIDVKGKTHTPDFSVDVAGQPVPLDTTFHAIVDGLNGDTELERVDGRFLHTSLVARGAVVGGPRHHGRTVKLDVAMADGRIEDVLKLAVKSATPVMTGALSLHTKLLLPPGEEKVADRLQLDGRFDVATAHFSSAEVRGKLRELSARSRGKDVSEVDARVVSNLRGRFTLGHGVVRFSSLEFTVPGADVRLAGTYGLRTGALDFHGTLRMRATVSQAAGGGIKSWLLKVIDPLFRKKGAGAILPIKITGTREAPKFGVDIGKVF
ncbi:MAG TPA: AsmA-like C-terminal region-containing protein [Vicinamibacterales bacterium]|nr:AsmA-like C-terminal region-containing protein [Vicinamibacterales bacterium]